MADYYVDNSGGDGDGSFGNPWNNIAGHIGLSAGDVMHVRGNASAPARVYTETTISITANGASGNRITVQPYLSELVCIKNDNTYGYIFDIIGDWWTVQNFEIDGNVATEYGIHVQAHRFQLLACAVHNLHQCGVGIKKNYTHTEIRDCHIHHCDRSYVDEDAHGVLINIGCDYTIVDGNTIHDCSGDCVVIDDFEWASAADNLVDGEITNNVLYRGTRDRCEQAIDSKCAKDLLISGNEMYDFGTGAGESGGAVVFHQRSQDGIVIEDNHIYDCDCGIYLGGGVTNAVMRRNLIHDLNDWGLAIPGGVANLDVYNNTFANVAGYGLHVYGTGLRWNGGILKNNLWYDCGNLYLEAGATISITVEYNGRWDTTSDAAFVDAGTDTTGSGDPNFKDAANDDFTLRRGSPAINAGVDVGLDYIGSAPDLGYDEYRRPVIISSWF